MSLNAFLQKIKYRENENLKKLSHLQNVERRIGLFGAGGYASTMIDELRNWGGIQIDFCIVDDRFYQPNMKCNHTAVISLQECNTREKGAVVLTAFGMTYRSEQEELKRLRASLDASIELIDFEDQYVSYFYYLGYDYVAKNAAAFASFFRMLEPESKCLLIDYINGRISGDLHAMRKYARYDNHDYSWDLLCPQIRDGTVIDCGAFDGNSSIQLNRELSGRNTILALECDPSNYALLCRNTKDDPQIHPICKGVWDHSTRLGVQGLEETATLSCETDGIAPDTLIDVTAIDDLQVGKVDAIIMDIEGSEGKALSGARDTINRDHPVLAIRMYHRPDDFVSIPQFFQSVDANRRYHYYLRYDCRFRGAADLTLYAI